MRFTKNEKKIDPRYFLDETAVKNGVEEAAKKVPVRGGGGHHGAWVEADAKCAKLHDGRDEDGPYKKCMDRELEGVHVDESIGFDAMRRDIAASQKERGFEPAGTGTPTADDWTIRTRAINSLLSDLDQSTDLDLKGSGEDGEFRSDKERAEALRKLADQLEDDHDERGADLGL